ncbi:GNAT family N-acetyltransferase [Herbiconiux sp.]|uniref:GNAT family N-acetyltransferase n=1 Tax=Herbiconiux sp. TaxID=1871186 RepID=UPI00344D3EF9
MHGDPTWVSGTHEHRASLNRFVCATPAKPLWDRRRGTHHPEPWSLAVQSWFRRLRPPLPASEGLLLGMVDDDVAAACHFGFDTSWEQFIVFAIGTSRDVQRRGLGSEALRLSLDILDQNRRRLEMDCGVFTRIHRSNTASRALFASQGFEYLGVEGDYENWVGTTG